MRASLMAWTALALVCAGDHAVLAGDTCGDPASNHSTSGAVGECAPSRATASRLVARGKVIGRFDPAMSGVCRFGCATRLKYAAKDVLAQPGAKAGKLTQCPVSGVVFAVDANRPRVRFAGAEYVTCCEKCAERLRRNPRHYLKG